MVKNQISLIFFPRKTNPVCVLKPLLSRRGFLVNFILDFFHNSPFPLLWRGIKGEVQKENEL